MIPRKVPEEPHREAPQLLRKSSTILSLTNEALCLAVSTALRLVDGSAALHPPPSPPDRPAEETLTLAMSNALRIEPKMDTLPEISLDQVSWHDTSTDCWIVVYDRVYDITEFLYEHPGGEEVLLEYAGRDATLSFRGVGHSAHAWRALDKYLIGVLPDAECIFKKGNEKLLETAPLTASLAASC